MGKYTHLYMESKKAEDYRKKEKKDFFRQEPLSAVEVKDATILPAKADINGNRLWCIGGVIDEKGKYVEESSTENLNLFGGIYEFEKKDVQIIDEEVIFMGPFLSHWGHFICDQISRLWFILENPRKYKIAYCGLNWGAKETDLWGNYLEFFTLLGIEKEQLINIKVPTKFKKIIIPEFSFVMDNYYTKEFKKIFTTVISNIEEQNLTPYEKIFYSRQAFIDAKSRENGEKELQEIFSENGYKVIEPEKLTLSEQIFYMNHCKEMAATSGSITHNLLFAPEGLNVIILNKMYLMNNYQMVIDSIMDVNIICVDVYTKIFPVCFGLGPFVIGINGYFKKFAHDYGFKIPITLQINILRKLSKIFWYMKRYVAIYGRKNNRDILIRQQRALKALLAREANS